jgi:hypothetical protein
MLLLDMSIESHVGQLALEPHRRISGCHRRHAGGKENVNTTCCKYDGQDQTDHDAFYHLRAPVVREKSGSEF